MANPIPLQWDNAKDSQKSLVMKGSDRHLDKFGEPSDDDFAIIREMIPSEVNKSDIFVYSVKLCDNLVDRDGEYFSKPALESLVSSFKGVTGIYNHDWSSGNQHSRIYKAKLVEDSDVKNESNEPYRYVVGYAYTLNNEKNKDLIENIKTGILKEVSIGFKHDEGVDVKLKDGSTAHRIDTIKDVYEFSFVAVPAQRQAGVVKSYNKEEGVSGMKLAEALVKLKGFDNVDTDVVSVIEKNFSDLTQIESLKAKVKSLEADVDAEKAKVKELEEKALESALEHALADVLSGFELVSDVAGQLATDVAQKELSVSEDGVVEGVEQAKEKLASDYAFLFKQAEQVEDEPLKQDDEVENDGEKVAEKSAKVPKGIDFTRVAPKLKSATGVKVRKGIHFN